MRIEVSPTARQHLVELVEWWDANRPEARVRVEDAFGKALDLIASHPKLGSSYPRDPRYRMWGLKGTPYYAFYRVDEKKKVVLVAAVWSAARGDGPPL